MVAKNPPQIAIIQMDIDIRKQCMTIDIASVGFFFMKVSDLSLKEAPKMKRFRHLIES